MAMSQALRDLKAIGRDHAARLKKAEKAERRLADGYPRRNPSPRKKRSAKNAGGVQGGGHDGGGSGAGAGPSDQA